MAADKNQPTPMRQQYNAIKAENQDSILLFRLGDFYEMFDDDAVTAARELDQVGGQAVLGRQHSHTTPWLTERHGYDPT